MPLSSSSGCFAAMRARHLSDGLAHPTGKPKAPRAAKAALGQHLNVSRLGNGVAHLSRQSTTDRGPLAQSVPVRDQMIDDSALRLVA